MSANLWNGRADPDGFANLVAAMAVDVVAVQELSPDQAEALAAVMPYGRLDPALDYCGMGIALRRPGQIENVPLAYRDARLARLEPSEWSNLSRPLSMVNLHIAAPHVIRPIFGLSVRSKQLRSFQAYLSRSSASGTQRVVVGDFNATPAWPVYRRISSHLTDAAVTIGRRRGEGVSATWGPWSGSPRLARIDHAFVEGVAVDDFRVVDIPGSDHDAVVVDVSSGRSDQNAAELAR